MSEIVLVEDYKKIKEEIGSKLNQVAESFVAIGYRLKQIRDTELYLEDGYKDIYEFAQEEYNLSKSNTSRFMSINDKFSVGGNTPTLIEAYEGYGSSKLSEMLTLENEDLKFITKGTTIAEIREIKQVKKEYENTPVATSQQPSINRQDKDFKGDNFFTTEEGKTVIIEFFKEREKNILNNLIKLINTPGYTRDYPDEAREIINPSNHLMFRKGFTVLMFEEEHINLRKFGADTRIYSYLNFYEGVTRTYLDYLYAADPYKEFYGEEEPEEALEEIELEIKEDEELNDIEEDIKAVDEEVNETADIEQRHIDEYPEYRPEVKELEEPVEEILENTEELEELKIEPEENIDTAADVEVVEAEIVEAITKTDILTISYMEMEEETELIILRKGKRVTAYYDEEAKEVYTSLIG